MAPRDSRKSRISATRMEVSCRQNQRAQPITPMPTAGPAGLSSSGAVESWAPAAASVESAAADVCEASSGVSVVALSVVLMCL